MPDRLGAVGQVGAALEVGKPHLAQEVRLPPGRSWRSRSICRRACIPSAHRCRSRARPDSRRGRGCGRSAATAPAAAASATSALGFPFPATSRRRHARAAMLGRRASAARPSRDDRARR
jgi:hypothetical protein